MSDVERLLDAVVSIASDLDLNAVLRRIVDAACEQADAQYGALGVLGANAEMDDLRLVEFITVGADEETISRIGRYPRGQGTLGLIFQDARPVRISDLTTHPQFAGFPEGHPRMTSYLGVPVRSRGGVFGTLYLTEKRNGGEFTDTDEQRVVALAAAAGVAIENARLHERDRELAIIEDRERIARDLHDTVIQQLFTTGLSLQGLTRRVEDVAVADRIQQAIADLDNTIRNIRGVIFALHGHERGEQSLRIMILALVSEVATTLGFEPTVHFDGEVDSAIGAELTEHLMAVLRELLSNLARHSFATCADVHLRVGADISLAVVDNGVGPGMQADAGRGLANLSQRAESMGGEFSAQPAEPRGTATTWTVPRPRSTVTDGS